MYSLALSAVDHGSQPDFFMLLFWKLSNREEERKLTLSKHFKDHSLPCLPQINSRKIILCLSPQTALILLRCYEGTSS